jgi:hypothetical protein
MANDKTTDPAAVFQDWVTQWERAADKFSNEFMGTDEFSKSMNQMQNFQLEFQRGFGELMAKQLANFNFPTREDVLQLSEDVRDIDRRLGRIETAIRKLAPEDSSGSSPKRKSPPRTKKPAAAPKDED